MKKFEMLMAACNAMVDIHLNGGHLSQLTSMAGQRAAGTLAIDEDSIFVSPAEMVQVTITPAVNDKVWISRSGVQIALNAVSGAPSVDGLFEQMRDLLFAGWASDGVTGFDELMRLISQTQGQIAKSGLLFKRELAKRFGDLVTKDSKKRKAWKSFKRLQEDREIQKNTFELYKKVQREILGL